ncbi:hypothetical protein L6303_01805 [archaeon]|nr:hypothetical protein [archaeon]
MEIPGRPVRIEVESNMTDVEMKKYLRAYHDKGDKHSEDGFIEFLKNNNVSAKILNTTYVIDEY